MPTCGWSNDALVHMKTRRKPQGGGVTLYHVSKTAMCSVGYVAGDIRYDAQGRILVYRLSTIRQIKSVEPNERFCYQFGEDARSGRAASVWLLGRYRSVRCRVSVESWRGRRYGAGDVSVKRWCRYVLRDAFANVLIGCRLTLRFRVMMRTMSYGSAKMWGGKFGVVSKTVKLGACLRRCSVKTRGGRVECNKVAIWAWGRRVD